MQVRFNKAKSLPWVIWFLTALFYLYENILQVSPGVMVPDLLAAFSINSGALGGLIAFFFYAYAGMQIPVGVLVDNYNARFLLTGATLACVLGCILFGTATHFAVAAVGRLLIGFGAAFAAVCSMKLASNWFPARQFSLLVGLMVTMGMFGSMLGEKPLALMVEQVGWRHSLLFLAGVGLFLAVLIICIIRHSPKESTASKTKKKKHQTESLLHGLWQVVQCRQSWTLAIYGGLMFASTSVFGGLWGVPFIMKAYHLDRPTAAGVVSIMFFGWVIGSPLSGMLVNWLNSYKKVLATSSIGCLIILVAVLYMPVFSVNMLSALIFFFGLFSALFLPSFSLMHDLHSAGNNGAALGFMNTANMIGGAVGQPLIGFLLDLTWDGTMAHHARVYSIQNYQISLACLPLIIALSIGLIPFIKEKK